MNTLEREKVLEAEIVNLKNIILLKNLQIKEIENNANYTYSTY